MSQSNVLEPNTKRHTVMYCPDTAPVPVELPVFPKILKDIPDFDVGTYWDEHNRFFPLGNRILEHHPKEYK